MNFINSESENEFYSLVNTDGIYIEKFVSLSKG
jgi:hypothetical protein